MRRHEINIQEGQLFEWLKSRKPLTFELTTGRVVEGRVFRFDRYCILVDSGDGLDAAELIYKHALASISPVTATGSAAHASRRSRAAIAALGRVAIVGGHR